MFEMMQNAMDRLDDACPPLNDRTVRMMIDITSMPDIQRETLGFTSSDAICLDIVFLNETDRQPLIRMSHPSQAEPNQVMKHLIRAAEQYVKVKFRSDGGSALWRLYTHVQARVFVFTERCVVCDTSLAAPGLKPVPCDDKTCAFAFDDLGVGSGVDEAS